LPIVDRKRKKKKGATGRSQSPPCGVMLLNN
jgi:hypothetical protein